MPATRTARTTAAPALASLAARVDGEIVLPDAPEWDDARRAWNLTVDQRPAAVVRPLSAADVGEIVRFASENGLRVAPQGTGHGASVMGSLESSILLRTDRMTGVAIDPRRRRARAAAGTLWGEVVDAAAPYGLVALHGSSPDVGVVGYSLGGGIGWLARKHGLATNSVLAADIVTAEGVLRRIDREHDPDLFWAIRGGGGSFGVVTALELALYPLREVYAGWLVFPFERSSEVLHAWREWTADAPDEVTSVGRLLQLPPVPQIPEPLRGGSFAVVEVAFLGGATEGEALLRPLRGLGPILDTVATVPAAALGRLHQDPEGPTPAVGNGSLLEDLPAEAVDAVVEAAGPGSGSRLLSVEIRHLGGALAEPKPENGALASLEGGYASFSIGMPMDPAAAPSIADHVERVQSALAPWDARSTYMNFTEEAGARPFHSDSAERRLRRVKAAYDPADVFLANHPVAPAS